MNSSPSGPSFLHLFVLFVLLALLLVMLVGAIGIEIPVVLVFGWIQFLSRVLPKISWNWDLVGMAVVCIAALLGLGHVFIKWLAREIAGARGKPPWSWPWRWTWCGAAGLGVLFLVGMAVGGICHQAAWIAGSPEPLYGGKGRIGSVSEIKRFREALRNALDDSKGDLQRVRDELRRSQNQYYSALPGQAASAERIACLLMVDSYGKCFGAIVFPRVKSASSGPNELFYWHVDHEAWLPRSELDSLLRKHQRQLMAL
jgi:hypothetical protein